jgi:hypothetical protein
MMLRRSDLTDDAQERVIAEFGLCPETLLNFTLSGPEAEKARASMRKRKKEEKSSGTGIAGVVEKNG